MSANSLKNAPTYERIYALARLIPAGKVATYGQLAAMVGSCTARVVGYAMAALPHDTDVPWQRVINRQGKISLRAGSNGGALQRQLLEAEGVKFDPETEKVDFDQVGWAGPDWAWLEQNGFQPGPVWGGNDAQLT
ncbi:MAG: MGMT family protein [Anaerolineae bacterium]|nr:MGMT family protein [Anaerolineae bacterium]